MLRTATERDPIRLCCLYFNLRAVRRLDGGIKSSQNDRHKTLADAADHVPVRRKTRKLSSLEHCFEFTDHQVNLIDQPNDALVIEVRHYRAKLM